MNYSFFLDMNRKYLKFNTGQIEVELLGAGSWSEVTHTRTHEQTDNVI